MTSGSKILVWDLPVRVMHWALPILVVCAWLTRKLEGDWFAWHVRCGYAVLVIAATRITWGFVGTRYALFKDFVRGPASIVRYLRARESWTSVGHNPAGGWMVIALLGLLLVQAITGLFANDQISETGPLFGYVTIDRSDALTTIHKWGFDVLKFAILFHVAAVLFHRVVWREQLVRPMLSGYKPLATADAASQTIARSLTVRAVLIAAVFAGALWWLVRTAPEASLFAF